MNKESAIIIGNLGNNAIAAIANIMTNSDIKIVVINTDSIDSKIINNIVSVLKSGADISDPPKSTPIKKINLTAFNKVGHSKPKRKRRRNYGNKY